MVNLSVVNLQITGRVSEDLFYDGSLCIMQEDGLIMTFAIHVM